MKIVFHKNFTKNFRSLNPKIQKTFYRRLKLFSLNSFHIQLHNHSVDGIYPECRSINITGDFRAIYREDGGTAIFMLIGSHSELYG